MKPYIKAIVQEACMITTCIIIILAVGEQSSDYDRILQTKHLFPLILLLSLMISLSSQLFSLFKTEKLSIKLLLHLLHMFVIIAIVLCFGSLLHWFTLEDPSAWISISIEVMIIYGFVSYFTYHNDQLEAQSLTEQLRKYKTDLHQDEQ